MIRLRNLRFGAIPKPVAILGLLLAAALPSHADPAFQQCTHGIGGSSVNSFNFSFAAATTAGNYIFVFQEGYDGGGTMTPSDDGSNTYTQERRNTEGGASDVSIYDVPNAASATTITITYQYNSSSSKDFVLACEISGIASSSQIDAFATDAVVTGSNITSLASNALTTANPSDLLIYAVAQSNSTFSGWTAGSGFSIPTGGAGADSTHHFGVAIQSEYVTSTQSGVTTTQSWAGNSYDTAGMFVSIKAAGGGGGGGATAAPTQMMTGVGE
jgi:hypothetical protein